MMPAIEESFFDLMVEGIVEFSTKSESLEENSFIK